jgi:hypothetical protein
VCYRGRNTCVTVFNTLIILIYLFLLAVLKGLVLGEGVAFAGGEGKLFRGHQKSCGCRKRRSTTQLEVVRMVAGVPIVGDVSAMRTEGGRGARFDGR